jgi:RNA polymerase I-specific transcription initiation factor RRN3
LELNLWIALQILFRQKLDAIMLLVFQFFEKEGKDKVIDSRKLYARCYPAFESSILIAHRSKFVQFILFFLCGLENDALEVQNVGDKLNQEHATLYREFVARLLELVIDPYRPSNVRQCAACYLASFVSRARFVGADTLCECLCALLRWAETYIATLPSVSISASDARDQSSMHALFYTICQAAFYIMCFRGAEAIHFYKDVEEHEKSKTEIPTEEGDPFDVELYQVDISPIRWSRICGHGLQPLRFCLETVRVEFLHIADIYDLLDAKLLRQISTEQDRQSSGPRKAKKSSQILTPATLEVARVKGGVGGLGRGSNPLDSFFPFDPYLLRRSHEYIEPFYRQWGEDDDEDDSVDMQEDDEEQNSQATDVSDLDDSSTSSGGEDPNYRGS